jgi:hypothetical protein
MIGSETSIEAAGPQTSTTSPHAGPPLLSGLVSAVGGTSTA